MDIIGQWCTCPQRQSNGNLWPIRCNRATTLEVKPTMLLRGIVHISSTSRMDMRNEEIFKWQFYWLSHDQTTWFLRLEIHFHMSDTLPYINEGHKDKKISSIKHTQTDLNSNKPCLIKIKGSYYCTYMNNYSSKPESVLPAHKKSN